MEEDKQEIQFKPSTVAELKVARLHEMGAFLDAQTGSTSDDILLHKTQQTAPVKVGDVVKVSERSIDSEYAYTKNEGRSNCSLECN